MLFNRDRALQLMKEFDVEALLATTRHNVLYLSGFQGWAQYTYGDATTETFALFFSRDEIEPALIVSRQDETYYSSTGSWIEDVRGYGPRSALNMDPGEQGGNEEEKNYLNEHPKNNKNEKYKAQAIEVAGLDKSRIKQLMQLKEEAEANQDFDKIQEIDAELFQMKS